MTAGITAGFCFATIFQCAAMTVGQLIMWGIQIAYEKQEKKKGRKKEKAEKAKEEARRQVKQEATRAAQAADKDTEKAAIEARYGGQTSDYFTPPSLAQAQAQVHFEPPDWNRRLSYHQSFISPFSSGLTPLPLVPPRFERPMWNRGQHHHSSAISPLSSCPEAAPPPVWRRRQSINDSSAPLTCSPNSSSESHMPVSPQSPMHYSTLPHHFPQHHFALQNYNSSLLEQFFPLQNYPHLPMPQDFSQQNYTPHPYPHQPQQPPRHKPPAATSPAVTSPRTSTTTPRSSTFSNTALRSSLTSLATVKEEHPEDPKPEPNLKPLDGFGDRDRDRDEKAICEHCVYCTIMRVWKQQQIEDKEGRGQPRSELSPLAARFPRDGDVRSRL